MIPRTTLILDPKLPPRTWETRRGTGSKLKRSRHEMDEPLLLEALEDPKAEQIAMGEEVHQTFLRLMQKPGLKTPLQRAAEEAAGVNRNRSPRAQRGKTVRDPFGKGSASSTSSFRSGLTAGFWNGSDPNSPGTSGPGGVAS